MEGQDAEGKIRGGDREKAENKRQMGACRFLRLHTRAVPAGFNGNVGLQLKGA